MNVADYYNKNTRRFLKTGTGSGEDAIHRPVWAPEVQARSDAVHFVDEWLIGMAKQKGVKGIIDLGCGVGGSIRYMAARFFAVYRGVTISEVQANIGAQNIAELNNGEIVLGDMTDTSVLSNLRASSGSPVMAFCYESFLHVSDGPSFIGTLAGALQPGDTFYICDDFLSDDKDKEDRVATEYKDGWHAPSLGTADNFISVAEASGLELESNDDLTPFLRLGGIKNKLIRLLVNVLRPFRLQGALWDNFRGGDALQKALSRGFIQYRLIGFRKR